MTDLEGTKGFYEGLLGLQQIERPNVPVLGVWYGCGQQQLHIVVVDEPVWPVSCNDVLCTPTTDDQEGTLLVSIKIQQVCVMTPQGLFDVR